MSSDNMHPQLLRQRQSFMLAASKARGQCLPVPPFEQGGIVFVCRGEINSTAERIEDTAVHRLAPKFLKGCIHRFSVLIRQAGNTAIAKLPKVLRQRWPYPGNALQVFQMRGRDLR